jgi:hypothetical protein
MPDLDAAERFRSRGEETRILAESMTTTEARTKLLSLVDQYERLAKRVEIRRDRSYEGWLLAETASAWLIGRSIGSSA